MSFKHRHLAERFITIMERAGAHVYYSTSGTGTIYVTVSGTFIVRFADHGECYCREDVSVDPDGCSLEQAVRAAARACALNVSRSLASFAAASTRAAREAPSIEAARKFYEAKDEFQRAYIAEKYADYATRSKKSRKRIRALANRRFESSPTGTPSHQRSH